MKTAILFYVKYFISIFANMKLNIYIFTTAMPLSIVMYYIQKYLFDEWEFAGFLVILMVIDTLAGFIFAWKLKKINKDNFSKVFVKAFAYAAFAITVHVLTHVKIGGNQIPFLEYVDYLALSGLIVREAISILDKLAKLSPGLVPKWLRKRLKDFDNLSGNLIDSKNNVNES